MIRAVPQRRLGAASLGFARQRWLVRALAGLGWKVVPAWQDCEAIAIWGDRPVAVRGRAIAARRGLDLLHIEDAFLRSVHAGQMPPAGLFIDSGGAHFDADAATDLQATLNMAPDPDASSLDALALIRHHQLSKYNAWPGDLRDLPRDFVLLVDQVPGDAALCGAGRAEFAAMLETARARDPGKSILIRAHPAAGAGHFAKDLPAGVAHLPAGLNPWDVLARAIRVHVMSSHLGAEAILAGHRPVIHGRPWYAGWGLSEDAHRFPARTATLTPEQMFEGGWARACHWFHPVSGRPVSLLRAVERLSSQARAAKTSGAAALDVMGCSRWKRRRVAHLLSAGGAKVTFDHGRGQRVGWASKIDPAAQMPRVEDGFLRSRGLGAALVPPVSLVLDRTGIHFDPSRPSDLEQLIGASIDLPDAALRRAARLRARLCAAGISKYNLPGPALDLPADRPVILIPGQVADDASVRLGGPDVTETDIARAARAARPEAFLLYRPHPDVSAGLRAGQLQIAEVDLVASEGTIADVLDRVAEVWTNTSLTGFEALLRGTPVTCLGQPFYAGWGLTTDLGGAPARRVARPELDQLIHAALIDYPLYLDPRTNAPCGPEDLLDWLEAGGVERGGLRAALWKLRR